MTEPRKSALANINTIIDILVHNSADVEDIIAQFGGIGSVIRAAPSLLRIMKTISGHRDAVEAAERAAEALPMYYDESVRQQVSDFQRKHGLKADGIVGQHTWAAVEALLGEHQ